MLCQWFKYWGLTQKALCENVCDVSNICRDVQVAETFDMDHSTEQGLSLKGRARLDNCVTVLDAAELFLNLDSIKSLRVTQHMLECDAVLTELLAPVWSCCVGTRSSGNGGG